MFPDEATTIQGIRVPLRSMRYHEPPRDPYPHRDVHAAERVILAAMISANVLIYGYLIVRWIFG